MREDLERFAGPAVPSSPAELADREAVSRLTKIYALGLDLRDYDLARSAFADDAHCSGAISTGPVDEYLPVVYNGAASFEATQHNMLQQNIVIEGDTATVWNYAIAVHKAHADDTDRQSTTLGLHYKDKCCRTGKGWLISERKVETFWIEMGWPSEGRE